MCIFVYLEKQSITILINAEIYDLAFKVYFMAIIMADFRLIYEWNIRIILWK